MPRRIKSNIEYLLKYWARVMAKQDQQWISEALFDESSKFDTGQCVLLAISTTAEDSNRKAKGRRLLPTESLFVDATTHVSDTSMLHS